MLNKNKIKIKLNGKVITVDKGIKLSLLINKYKFPLNKIAIERNNMIVQKKKLRQVVLKSNDNIEIVHFIGGG